MKYIVLILTALLAVAANAQSLEERIEELEIEKSLNYFKFSGDFTYMYDTIDTDPGSGGVESSEDWQRMRLGLNTMAKPYNDVTFYTRFAMSKFVNVMSNPNTREKTVDMSVGNDYSGANVVVEKAYFDYVLSDMFVLSMGRLPTHHGVPYNYSKGQSKMGTYPMMAYASSLDGIALTTKMNGHWGDLAARVVYTPVNFPTEANSISNKRGGSTNFRESSDATAFMIDYNNKDTGFADNLSFVAQYIHVAPLQFNDAVIARYAGTTPESVTYMVLPSTLQLELDFTTFHFELTNIAHTGFDFSISHVLTDVKSDGSVDFSALFGNPAGTNLLGYGAGANGEANGSATLVALNYRSGMGTIFGLEYLDSDKEYVYFDFVSDNLSDFYRTRGSSYHAFINHPFKPTLKGTLGYRLQKYDYDNSATLGFGTPSASDKEVATVYAQMRLDF